MGYPVRPSGYVGWGSTGMTNVAEPLDSKKATGWSVNEQPPSSYFNWIQSKQDEWLQYLDWRASLAPVVFDDFVYPPNATMWRNDWVNTGNPAGAPNDVGWISTGVGHGVAPLGAPVGAVGVRGGNGGFMQLSKSLGAIDQRDFRFEIIFQEQQRSASGTFELGLFNTTGMSQPFPQAGFIWTGTSGIVKFQYHPSGGGATSVSLNFNSMTGNTGYHRYLVENRNPTMAVYLDDVLQFAVKSVAFAIPTGIDFGVRVGHVSGEAVRASVDKLEFSVKR